MRLVLAIAVRNGEVLGFETNAHQEPCKREGYPTGEGYELCEGCNYPNHAEYKLCNGKDLVGATVYLIGHYYACEPCKNAIISSGATLVITNPLKEE